MLVDMTLWQVLDLARVGVVPLAVYIIIVLQIVNKRTVEIAKDAKETKDELKTLNGRVIRLETKISDGDRICDERHRVYKQTHVK